MQGGGPRGAPIHGPSHGADRGHGSPPAVAPQRRRLTRRPGYMRSTAGPGIGFLSPAVGMPRPISAGLTGQESHHSQSKAGRCGLDPRSHCQGSLVGNPFLKSSLDPSVSSVGHLHPAQGSLRERPVCFGVQSKNDSRQSERLTGPRKPGDSGCWQEFLSSDSSKSLAPGLDVAWNKGARGLKPVKPRAPGASDGPADIPSRPGFQDTFTSSFSFIRLSLGAAGERGEAEGCLPSREAEPLHPRPQEMAAEASGSDRPHGDPGHLCTFSLHTAPGSVDLAQVTRSSRQPECSTVSSSDAGFSSQDASPAGGRGDQGLGWADARGWQALLREWEPVLQDYLLSNRRQLEVTSLILKLQNLQEKAVEDGDYDTAETLRQRLEDLEQEKGRLPWALPSQQPALHSFLGYLAAKTRVALRGATQRAGSGDPEAPLEGQPRTTAQDSPPAPITRRDWLIRERQQLQKEMEALQARMSALEAEERRRRSQELEEQETLLHWQGCDLMALVAQMSPGQLQEVNKALGETLTSASQAAFPVEPPESLRSLRERTKSLNLAIRELTAQVCSGEKLCSSLRRRLSDLDTRLPALLEAKMLALSGSCFSTAKELEEEIWALSSEREGLETLLGRLLAFSSRTVRRLGSIKEDYLRCRQDLALQEAAHKTRVKANTAKSMEVLEGQLNSCRCPLLARVWRADLEACQVLMQSLQLQEVGIGPHAEDEKQVHSAGEAAPTAALAVPRTPRPEEDKCPLQVLRECDPHSAPSPRCAAGPWKEEPHVVSAEVGEKCEAIGVRLLHLEDELLRAMHSQDDALLHILSVSRELLCKRKSKKA
ncbi:disrupted in schizophrenia 1 protein isoform X1 [Apodemus sylvaticus]|uniref:disrupted in schizophrenia 1 protein isoform X1 n=1 Tax=Apodemus sylvaticus TaxID=10129 RepID=UPI002243F995|nr:disrupted in schizophrenia 1 protein isoform X1 [Apodemus sylvaticus]